MSDQNRPLKLVLKLGSDSVTKTVETRAQSYCRETDSNNLDSENDYTSNIPSDSTSNLRKSSDNHDMDHDQASNTSHVSSDISTASQRQRQAFQLCPLAIIQSTARKVFEWLLRQHERNDPHRIFQNPVTDQIAPGYSLQIHKPMCFNDIRAKIGKNVYKTVADISKDFFLVFENCITYNQRDTIFYSLGKKMLSFSKKLLSHEKLTLVHAKLPFLSSVPKRTTMAIFNLPLTKMSPDEVFSLPAPEMSKAEASLDHTTDAELQIDDVMSESGVSDHIQDNDSTCTPEDTKLSPSEIQSQVLQQAKLAKERLAKIRPGGNVSYLKRQSDGSTLLNVLIPSHLNNCKQGQKLQTIGELCGNLPSGCGKPTLPTSAASWYNTMHPKNKDVLTPNLYLDYGPFGTFAPSLVYEQYDKYSANELAIIRGAYESPAGALYAESLQSFVSSSAQWVIDYVDNLLDGFTGGKHTTHREFVKKRRKISKKIEDELSFPDQPVPPKPTKQIYKSIKSLTELGIDVSFIENPIMGNNINEQGSNVENVLGGKLNENSKQISEMKKMQDARLGQQPEYYGDVKSYEITKEEVKVADSVETNIHNMAKHCQPQDLISIEHLHKIQGIEIPDK